MFIKKIKYKNIPAFLKVDKRTKYAFLSREFIYTFF